MAKLGKFNNLFKLPSAGRTTERPNPPTETARPLVSGPAPRHNQTTVSGPGGILTDTMEPSVLSINHHQTEIATPLGNGQEHHHPAPSGGGAGSALQHDTTNISLAPGAATAGMTIIPRSHPSVGGGSAGSSLSSGGAALAPRHHEGTPETIITNTTTEQIGPPETIIVTHSTEPVGPPETIIRNTTTTPVGPPTTVIRSTTTTPVPSAASAGSALGGAPSLTGPAAPAAAPAVPSGPSPADVAQAKTLEDQAGGLLADAATQDQNAYNAVNNSTYTTDVSQSEYWHGKAKAAGGNKEGAERNGHMIKAGIFASEQQQDNDNAAPYDNAIAAAKNMAAQDSAQAATDRAQAAQLQQQASGFLNSSTYNIPGTSASAVHNNGPASAGGALAGPTASDPIENLSLGTDHARPGHPEHGGGKTFVSPTL